MVCRFSINTIAIGCEIKLQNSNISQTGKFHRDINNIAEGCISNIITGYYDLYVYDVENDNTLSQLPAIIKNQVFVYKQTTTSSTTTTVATTTVTTTTLVTTSVTSAGYTMLPTPSTSVIEEGTSEPDSKLYLILCMCMYITLRLYKTSQFSF